MADRMQEEMARMLAGQAAATGAGASNDPKDKLNGLKKPGKPKPTSDDLMQKYEAEGDPAKKRKAGYAYSESRGINRSPLGPQKGRLRSDESMMKLISERMGVPEEPGGQMAPKKEKKASNRKPTPKADDTADDNDDDDGG